MSFWKQWRRDARSQLFATIDTVHCLKTIFAFMQEQKQIAILSVKVYCVWGIEFLLDFDTF